MERRLRRSSGWADRVVAQNRELWKLRECDSLEECDLYQEEPENLLLPPGTRAKIGRKNLDQAVLLPLSRLIGIPLSEFKKRFSSVVSDQGRVYVVAGSYPISEEELATMSPQQVFEHLSFTAKPLYGQVPINGTLIEAYFHPEVVRAEIKRYHLGIQLPPTRQDTMTSFAEKGLKSRTLPR